MAAEYSFAKYKVFIRDAGLIPGLGRSPGEEMATHSSTLA